MLEKYNLFAMLDAEITKHNDMLKTTIPSGVIMYRQTLKFKKPVFGLWREAEKVFTKAKHLHWLKALYELRPFYPR